MIRKAIFILLFIPAMAWNQQKYWIFFKDKGTAFESSSDAIKLEKKSLSQKTLERRAKVLAEQNLIDETDLPVCHSYLQKLNQQGIKPMVVSRWLNGVSALLTEKQVAFVEALPFVKKVRRVSVHELKIPEYSDEIFWYKAQAHRFDYGSSLAQNEMIKVTEVQDLGLDGSGVLVGMLDTGYDYKNHEAFQHLQVLAEYDVINQDSVTSSEEADPSGQSSHGTITLSALAGFKAGHLIGPAYAANFLLAKTEVESSETEIEEDYWVAGLEWLERRGVEIVSSSLGYLDWYNYSDMDGKTAITTKAANIAVKKGVVIVNSNGNEGNNSWKYMIAPADGFDVISVGAVDSNGDLVAFSSRGPTYDGRIKPDVVAMGKGVTCVAYGSVDLYRTANGTSLSCPLIAGVATLILQAHPYLTPKQVKEAIRETADNAALPNNDYGWGLVNAYEAIFYHGLFFLPPDIFYSERQGHLIKIKIFSKYDLILDSLSLKYAVDAGKFSSIKLLPSTIEHEYHAWLPLQDRGSQIKLYFSAADKSGDHKNFPHKSPDAFFTFLASDTAVSIYEPPPADFKLYQNYPNPFVSETTIDFDIFQAGKATITIFNILGQKVKTLVDEYFLPDHHVTIWDGSNEKGEYVAAGIYICWLEVAQYSAAKRLVFLGAEKK